MFPGVDAGVLRKRPGSLGATFAPMTMYLSNRDIRPTGYELVEFIDVPPAPDDLDPPLCLGPDNEQEGSS